VALPEHGNLISGMGCDFRDLNNDGYPDIVLSALQSETFPIYQDVNGTSFEEITSRSGMTELSNPMSGYSVNIADFDNDGWKDIFVSGGDVASPNLARSTRVDQPNTVFRNLQGKWAALAVEAGFGAQPARRHRGAAVADFNGDGKLDLVVTALSAQAEIWMNDSPGANHWIEFALQGTKSNRDGIGARIKVTTAGKVQYDDGQRLCLLQRRTRSLRPGRRARCQRSRDSLAVRNCADAQECGYRSCIAGEGAALGTATASKGIRS